jgi:hypothetical protein
MKKIILLMSGILFFSIFQTNMAQSHGGHKRGYHVDKRFEHKGVQHGEWKKHLKYCKTMKIKIYDLIGEKINKLVEITAEKKSTEQKSTELALSGQQYEQPESKLSSLAKKAQKDYQEFINAHKTWMQEKEAEWQEKSMNMINKVMQDLKDITNLDMTLIKEITNIIEDTMKLLDALIMPKLIDKPVI